VEPGDVLGDRRGDELLDIDVGWQPDGQRPGTADDGRVLVDGQV
jgi:hypothetical protein